VGKSSTLLTYEITCFIWKFRPQRLNMTSHTISHHPATKFANQRIYGLLEFS
jgi:hypothetical protein